MSKNTIYVYTGIAGLFCECGNAEVITDENPTYKRFSSWHSTSGGRGERKAACLKCHSGTQTTDVRPQPADLRERLQVAYPGADIDELLAKASVLQ